MAILFLDSCDHYTDPAHKYDSNNLGQIVSGQGRNGTNCLRFSSNDRRAQKNLASAPDTIIMGFAFRRADLLSEGALLQFCEGSTVHVSLNSLVNGALSVGGPAGTLGSTSPGLVTGGVWVYVEIKAVIDDSSGSAEVRINGSSVLSLTSQDTQNGGTGVIDNIIIRSSGSNWDFDDIYIADDQDGVNDDFLGDVRVQYLEPVDNGSTNEWTPLAGENWENVDDTAPDGDSTYNSFSLATADDLYECAALAGSPTAVHAVQVVIRVREDDAVGHTVAPLIRASGTTEAGTAVTVNNNYATKTEVWNANPDTSAWDPADFPIEAGVRLVS